MRFTLPRKPILVREL